MRHAILAAPVLIGVAVACGDETTGPDPAALALAERIAPRLAVMAFAVANGPQGRAFFDNALPCVRRGVVNYANTETGRAVTFAGCDVGDGLTLDGTGELRWGPSEPAANREPLCGFGTAEACAAGFTWAGELRVTVDGEPHVLTEGFTVSDIVAAGTEPVELQSLRVALEPAAVVVTEAGPLLDQIFDPTGIDLGTIPNPSGSVATLSEADLRRIALHGAMDLAFFLLDETVESARGDHEHQMPCGTSGVTYDAEQLPHVTNAWSQCPDRGLLFDGDFTMEWGRWELNGRELVAIRMDLTGSLTIGGGIPTIELTSLRWTVTPSGTDLEITLELEGPGGARTVAWTIPVDD